MAGVPRKRMIWLCQSMATMLDAGLPVSRVLTVLSNQKGAGALHGALESTRLKVEAGTTLAEALGQSARFPDLFLQLVAAGEESGTLERTLKELTRYFEFVQRLWRNFLAAIAWPVMQYILAIGVIAFAFWILAMINEEDSSALTVLLLGYGIPVALVVAYKLIVNVLGGSRACHEVILRIPLLGKVLEAVALARFSLVMYLLTEAAVPIKIALARSLEATGNGAFAAQAGRAIETIEGSGNLTAALASTGRFPAEYLHIIEVAEDSGKMSERMSWLADHWVVSAERRIGALVAAVAVLIWVAVACIIIFFILQFFRQYVANINQVMR